MPGLFCEGATEFKRTHREQASSICRHVHLKPQHTSSPSPSSQATPPHNCIIMHRIFRPRRWHRNLHTRNLRHKAGANGLKKKRQQKARNSEDGLHARSIFGRTWSIVASTSSTFTWLLASVAAISTLAVAAIFILAIITFLSILKEFIEHHRSTTKVHQYRTPLFHKFLNVLLLGVSPLYVASPAVDDRTFSQAGRTLIWRSGYRRMSKRKFKAYFGATPQICADIWQMINPHEEISSYAKPVHLLWALMLIKVYATEEVLSGIAGVTEKTFRKWAWKFIQATADLSSILVSQIFISSNDLNV